MSTFGSSRRLLPQSAGPAGVISWVHIGGLHITKAGEQIISTWQRLWMR